MILPVIFIVESVREILNTTGDHVILPVLMLNVPGNVTGAFNSSARQLFGELKYTVLKSVAVAEVWKS